MLVVTINIINVRTFSHHQFFYREWIRKSFPADDERMNKLVFWFYQKEPKYCNMLVCHSYSLALFKDAFNEFSKVKVRRKVKTFLILLSAVVLGRLGGGGGKNHPVLHGYKQNFKMLIHFWWLSECQWREEQLWLLQVQPCLSSHLQSSQPLFCFLLFYYFIQDLFFWR